MKRIWVRWDPTTEEAVAEDETGNTIDVELEVERDGAFYLVGPLDVEDEDA